MFNCDSFDSKRVQRDGGRLAEISGLSLPDKAKVWQTNLANFDKCSSVDVSC